MRGIILGVEPGAKLEEPDAGRAVRPGAGGVVPRPGLFGRLAGQARVVVVSAPPGSGKTVLLRSWISRTGLAGRTGWVAAGPDGRDPQRFWVSVLGALRTTVPGSALVQAATAAPGLDGWATVERLLTDLAPLRERLWLVIDDVHELDAGETLRQLGLLVLRAPLELRFVLATRHDVRLGLHQLRLTGELAEIREPDLRFTVAEARALFDAAGVELSEPTVVSLQERTEGWAAGLRLAALSLAGHPDPGRFAAGFSGTDRTVAEYLLAEVLDRQPAGVRRLLLRTSVLDRVNGELADLLTGDEGGERVLQDLEDANAFVVSLEPSRSWFRYHQLFAGLLAQELRRTAPGDVAGLHRAASGWFADHGFPVEAIRHAQAAKGWDLAARLLADHWPGLYLDGQAATVHELLAGFPAWVRTADVQLVTVTAADYLAHGSVATAERYLSLAESGAESMPDARSGQLRVLLGVVRLLLARQRGNTRAVDEEARRLDATATEAAQPALGEDLRALALISLGSTMIWTRARDAQRHLEAGIALAQRIGRPYLAFSGLARRAAVELNWSFTSAAECSRQAIELAERHGWTGEPTAGYAYGALASLLLWQGRLEEADPLLQRAERTLTTEFEPAGALALHHLRGMLTLARGRDADAISASRAAELMAGCWDAPGPLFTRVRAGLAQAVTRQGNERAEQMITELSGQDRGRSCIVTAVLRLAQGDPGAASAALGAVLDGSAPVPRPALLTQAFLLEAIARDALSDPVAARSALERALSLAEPDEVLFRYLLYPVLRLEQHAGRRAPRAALTAEIAGPPSGNRPAPPAGPRSPAPRPPLEPLTSSELRVLRYLPASLTAPEIARELSVSHNTVKTHLRNLYAKLGTHQRAEAVARARALGLLAPPARC